MMTEIEKYKSKRVKIWMDRLIRFHKIKKKKVNYIKIREKLKLKTNSSRRYNFYPKRNILNKI